MMNPWSALSGLSPLASVTCQAADSLIAPKENLIMNIEKRNIKMFYLIAILVLATILVTAFGGYMLQQQTMPSRDSAVGRSTNPNPLPLIQPELAQTGPTGRLVMSTGIILLLVGSGIIVVLLWAGRSRLHSNPS